MLKKHSSTACALALAVLSGAPFAAAHADGDDILCAVLHTVSCGPVGDCIEGPATVHNLPVFLRFHPDKKTIEEVKAGGEQRSSTIASVGGDANTLVMLGTDAQSGWSATIDKGTGRMTATVALNGEGYLIFGSCVPK